MFPNRRSVVGVQKMTKYYLKNKNNVGVRIRARVRVCGCRCACSCGRGCRCGCGRPRACGRGRASDRGLALGQLLVCFGEGVVVGACVCVYAGVAAGTGVGPSRRGSWLGRVGRGRVCGREVLIFEFLVFSFYPRVGNFTEWVQMCAVHCG